jgi:hypothetical protein
MRVGQEAALVFSNESKDERLRSPRFMVNWQGRAMLADRSVYPAIIKTASSEGFGLEMDQAVSLGKNLNLEIFINYRGEEIRLRAKLSVIYCMVLSDSRGTYMEAKITQMADKEMQAYNDLLMDLGNAKEFDLRI